MKRLGAVVGALVLSACGPVEVRIDETKGVPPVKGQTEVTLGANFTCGMPITSGGKTVQTRVVSAGCEFTFDDSIEVLQAQDYQSIPELKASTNLVQRVELTIKKLTFADGATGQALDLSTRIASVDLQINGQTVADKAKLTALPTVVRLEGAALNTLKTKVDARQPASVGVKAIAVVPTSPPPPERLKLDYEAQPAIVLGPGEVKIF